MKNFVYYKKLGQQTQFQEKVDAINTYMNQHVVDRKQLPELDKLLWDRKTQILSPSDAMRTYERRWGFVDIDKLTQNEKTLIRTLADDIGGYIPVSI